MALLFFYFYDKKGVLKTMAQPVQDSLHERIEIVDQPDDVYERRRRKFWLRIPIALVFIVILFFVIRRFMNREEF